MAKVRYNQKGYVGCSMSKNAAFAYEMGEKPKSRWSKAAMLQAIADYCDGQGIPYDGSAALLRKDELFEQFFEWRGWHHTGKYANETDFYGLDEDEVWEIYGKEIA